MKLVRSWSHTFWVENDKKFVKNFSQSVQKQRQEGRRYKRKEERQWQNFLRYTQMQKIYLTVKSSEAQLSVEILESLSSGTLKKKLF